MLGLSREGSTPREPEKARRSLLSIQEHPGTPAVAGERPGIAWRAQERANQPPAVVDIKCTTLGLIKKIHSYMEG